MTKQGVLSGLFYFIALIIFSSCAQIRPKTLPSDDLKALSLANRVKSFNQHITAGKGSGWLTLQTSSKTTKFKVAWAAVFPNKIRITFLLSGYPVETIVATGEKVTFFSHIGEHPKRSYMSKDPDMKGFIKVPVKLSEMILVLLGRLPVKKFDDSYFSPSDPSLSTVILNQKWQGRTQSLQIDGDGKVVGLKSKDDSGNLLYEIGITKYKTYGLDDIPVMIELTGIEREKVTLEILNFLPNPSIKESVFRLTESG